ncbi:MAG: metal-dependent hydrolase [Caldisericales bacterium]|nr:metal-dependent hydrolase [Caldisericales bacterium]
MVRITYIGHSCVLIQSNGTQVIIDPYIEKNSKAILPPKGVNPKLILVTHGHHDHLGDTVALAKKCKAKVMATSELADFLASKGLDVLRSNFGGKIPFDFGWVKVWPAMHTSSSEGVDFGLAASFVVSIGGKSIYHAGDTCLTSDMALIGEDKPIDLACLPIGGVYTMGIDDAVKAVGLIKPRVVLPIHYNTFDAIRVDPEEFSQKIEKLDIRTKPVVLNSGEQLELT